MLMLRYIYSTFYRRKRLSCFLTFIVLCLITHLVIFPLSMGYYDAPCYMTMTQNKHLKCSLMQLVLTLFSVNQIFWIDYGVLLGYWRIGNFLPHDGDLDISRLRYESDAFENEFLKYLHSSMNEKPMECRGHDTKLDCGDISVDLYQWMVFDKSPNEVNKIKRAYYNPSVLMLVQKEKMRNLSVQSNQISLIDQYLMENLTKTPSEEYLYVEQSKYLSKDGIISRMLDMVSWRKNLVLSRYHSQEKRKTFEHRYLSRFLVQSHEVDRILPIKWFTVHQLKEMAKNHQTFDTTKSQIDMLPGASIEHVRRYFHNLTLSTFSRQTCTDELIENLWDSFYLPVPSKTLKIIQLTYPYSWFVKMPYKWKCYFSSGPS
ncbi:hypothetical protein SNEBB_011006 [Seison nebaliae]|nr:hypothetical protein SNEBB_011006 [Seison nebaliae]